MFFKCCQSPEVQPSFLQSERSQGISNVLDKLPLCSQHQQKVNFVCSNSQCIQDPLICTECLSDHQSHKWAVASKFFDEETQITIRTGANKLSQKIKQASRDVRHLVQSFRQNTIQKIGIIDSKLNNRLQKIKQVNQVKFQPITVIDNQAMKKLINLKNNSVNLQWIQNMKVFLKNALESSKNTVDVLMQHFQKTFDLDWKEKTRQQIDFALYQFKTKIVISNEVNDKFMFSKDTKHAGINLSQNFETAIFNKNIPTCPAAILSKSIQKHRNKFSFKIQKLNSKALVFDASTIFIGVCKPSVVKYVGMRRINQISKGSYMIGSSGWSYHHKSAIYDRKAIVGFGFGEGDVIDITLQFQTGTLVFFKKGRFKFLDKQFKMPLDLTGQQLIQLRPCVSFDGDVGAEVTVINYQPPQVPQNQAQLIQRPQSNKNNRDERQQFELKSKRVEIHFSESNSLHEERKDPFQKFSQNQR